MTHAHVTDRRIAAGDWVRMTGLSPSLRGVGKVVDADYDPKDGAMRAARVDMGAREYWIPVAELSRVQPDEEARLAQVAHDRGLVDEERAPERARRLERVLAAVAQGTASYVRSPGLLDLLWPFTSHADPDHGSRALSGLFDEALDLLVAARLERTRASSSSPTATPWETIADTWTGGFPVSEVVPRLLSQLDRLSLVGRAEAMGIDVAPVANQSTQDIRTFVARRVGVAQLLQALWLRQLRDACREGLGMRDADALSPDELRERVLGFVERASGPTAAPPPSATPIDRAVLDAVTASARAEAARALGEAAARVNAQRQREQAAARRAEERRIADLARARRTSTRLLPPARPDEVLPRILATLNHQSLLAIARAHGVPAPSSGRHSHRALGLAIIRAGVTLETALTHLTLNQLRLACGAVGFTGEIESDPDALRARLLAAATPTTDAPPA